jgi:hypothetical protein
MVTNVIGFDELLAGVVFQIECHGPVLSCQVMS